jgi:hypothetical protein
MATPKKSNSPTSLLAIHPWHVASSKARNEHKPKKNEKISY